MGRELKRVPLDFDWPLNEVWQGFINPHYRHRKQCPGCQGSGYSPEAKRLSDQWYGYAYFEPSMTGSQPLTVHTASVRAFAQRNVIGMEKHQLLYFFGSTDEQACVGREAQRLIGMWNRQWCHHLDSDDVQALLDAGRLWDLTQNGHRPTPQEVNEWAILTFGHDAINQWVCVKAKALRLGCPLECEQCQGDGDQWDSEEHKQAAESWQKTEPPIGEGYQLWETVSEGSPISPVFATAGEFENHLVSEGYSRRAAQNFIGSGWAPSMVMSASGLKLNIQACEEFGS